REVLSGTSFIGAEVASRPMNVPFSVAVFLARLRKTLKGIEQMIVSLAEVGRQHEKRGPALPHSAFSNVPLHFADRPQAALKHEAARIGDALNAFHTPLRLDVEGL